MLLGDDNFSKKRTSSRGNKKGRTEDDTFPTTTLLELKND